LPAARPPVLPHVPASSSKPDKQELLALILHPGGPPAGPGPAHPPPEPTSVERIRAKTEMHSDFQLWLRELERHLPRPSAPELDEYYHYALMGLVVGFGDRDLSPYVREHTAIIAPLLEDIRSVYEQVCASGAAYSREEFIFRAFDYGIHKAYYLDWDLYGSHDMY
jgi:hypothetical protein